MAAFGTNSGLIDPRVLESAAKKNVVPNSNNGATIQVPGSSPSSSSKIATPTQLSNWLGSEGPGSLANNTNPDPDVLEANAKKFPIGSYLYDDYMALATAVRARNAQNATPSPTTPSPTPTPATSPGLLDSAQTEYLDSIMAKIRTTGAAGNNQANLNTQLANIGSVYNAGAGVSNQINAPKPAVIPSIPTVQTVNAPSYNTQATSSPPQATKPQATNVAKTTTARTPASTPPVATGGANGGGMLATASQTKASTYDAAQLKDPAQWAIDNNQTAQGQLNNIIAADSPLMQQAETRGLSQAASRGLLNSSMAVGAAQDSVIAAATPIAQFDAAQYGNSAKFNTENKNTFATKNVDATNTSRQFNAQSQSHASDFNAAAANQASLSNSENLFRQAMNKENIASNESMQSAQLSSNEALQAAKLAADIQLQEGRLTAEQAMQSERIGSQFGLAAQEFGFDTSKAAQAGQIAAQAAAQQAGYTSVRDAALAGYDADAAARLAQNRQLEAAQAAGYQSIRDAQLNGYDVAKAVQSAEIKAIENYQLHGFDLETARNLAATNMSIQQYQRESDVIMAGINNNAQMDREQMKVAGTLAQDFNQQLAAINADPYMTQAAKDYAANQLFKNYKNNVSMVEQAGTIPDISTLLVNTGPENVKKPSGSYYNMQATDQAQKEAAIETQRLASDAQVAAADKQYWADLAKAATTPKGGGGSMICTRLHELGYMDDDIFAADDAYADLLARDYPEFLKWYQSWAIDVVHAMHCETITSKLLSRGAWVFVNPWSKEMAYRMKARKKGHWFGSLMIKISHWLYLFSVK